MDSSLGTHKGKTSTSASDVTQLARTPTCNAPVWLLHAQALNCQGRAPSLCHPHQNPAKKGYLIVFDMGEGKCDLHF